MNTGLKIEIRYWYNQDSLKTDHTSNCFTRIIGIITSNALLRITEIVFLTNELALKKQDIH